MTGKILADFLRSFADSLEVGNTNATEEELLEVCTQLGFIVNPESKLSKYQSAQILDVNHKTFDYYVSKGYIPKGMDQPGFKEKFWYKRDIMKFKKEREAKQALSLKTDTITKTRSKKNEQKSV